MWLPMVESFEQQFGHHMVPVDVRLTASSIRGHLGLPVEPWPPALAMQRVDSERFEARIPSVVNDLGCELSSSSS